MRNLILVLTLMLSGRAMTLMFIHRAGGGAEGDPPWPWLMPLIGDAVVGLSGLFMAYLVLKRTGLAVWTLLVTWNAIGIWDALSAYILSVTAPWPEFFMLQIFGSMMFFAASAMHLILIYLLSRPQMLQHFRVARTP